MKNFRKFAFLPLLAAVALAGCASSSGGPRAEARLEPTQGNKVTGFVSFRPKSDGTEVVAMVGNLTPGAHGFHIHEKGDCSAPDATSAGAHFNPAGHAHGDPGQGEHHAGDLPQLMADASGNAMLTIRLAGLTIGHGESDVIGRGLIVHAAPDDYTTQPTGNSGARVACAVIEAR